MSLRRRIAGAAALAAAFVAVAVGGIGYASTRSHLIGQLQQQLHQQASSYLHNQPPDDEGQAGGYEAGGYGPGGGGQGFRGFAGGGPHVPPGPPFGGAPGYFQIVYPDASAKVISGSTQLPFDARAVETAKGSGASFFTAATVRGTHLEVLTVGDPYGHYAIQVALPLTSVDSVLSSLLITYAALVGGGVLLALLLGVAISRSALSPIERFLRRTEAVTSELDTPRRLEETGASELRRLAASFNQTLDALELSIEAQRHLIADASHELRTPIAALRSNIQIFLEAHRLPAHEREGLQQSILAELDELTQVVADVVELARGSAPSAHREALELDSIVHDAVERARRRAPTLHFNLELEPTVIEGVADRVARAVTNVIDNARKWSAPDGTVDVQLHRGTLTVRDHGPGFDERDLPHVFDRFYRSANARRLPGSGLGLAIVKQAAESHGGFVGAGNASDGGAVLRVSFGRLVAGEELAREPSPAAVHR